MRRLLALIAVLVLLPAPVYAHTEVVSTTPAANEEVTAAPTQVTITTVEAVREMGSAIVVTSPSGARVDDGSTEIDGRITLVGLVALTEFGTYTVDYRLLANDGHPIEGTFSFVLPDGGATQSPAPSPNETSEPEPADQKSSFPWPIALAALVALLSAGALAVRALRRR
jgi:copper resistance protein C